MLLGVARNPNTGDVKDEMEETELMLTEAISLESRSLSLSKNVCSSSGMLMVELKVRRVKHETRRVREQITSHVHTDKISYSGSDLIGHHS